jgi:hypothetical protein
MVRRRSTVRFRKGAPVQQVVSKTLDELWGQKWGQPSSHSGTSLLSKGPLPGAPCPSGLGVPRAVWVIPDLFIEIEITRR